MRILNPIPFTLLLTLTSSFLRADLKAQISDAPPLDKPYQRTHKIERLNHDIENPFWRRETKNNVHDLLKKQSPVKSQMSRGTCSIFSATALVEFLLQQTHQSDLSFDLSEEWLEYTALNGKTTDGSSAPQNFNAIIKHGMVRENTMPYIGDDWTLNNTALAQSRCGNLPLTFQKSCLVIHHDPRLLYTPVMAITDSQFKNARLESLKFVTRYSPKIRETDIYTEEQAKDILDNGMPVILEVDFYFGAWNHRGADNLGIDRDLTHWKKGIVFHPIPQSLDEINSRKNPSGHSVLVVGYDDNVVVTKNIKMKDGSTKTVSLKGVYYFKNSWGTDNFATEFEIDGVKYPGYGMIAQDYAHEHGAFYSLSL